MSPNAMLDPSKLSRTKDAASIGWIHFSYPGWIEPEAAKELQAHAGYMVAGYGFYGFKHCTDSDGTKATVWQCSKSCD